MLSKDDRIAFSLKIVKTDKEIIGLQKSKIGIQSQQDSFAKLDAANKRLFDPINTVVNSYQLELNYLTGQTHTTITEDDIQNAAKKIIRNYFFPNDPLTSVPSLSASNNVWIKLRPFALNFALGKNYSESYTATTKEQDLINDALAFISNASSYTDIQNTSGQHCSAGGTCSNPSYTDQPTCVLNGGIWTPGSDAIISFPEVQTLKTDLVNTINSLKALLLAEVAIIVTDDADSGRQAQNNAAINDINNAIIPALDSWLAYADFNTAHGQTTCAGFNSYNANLLAPTKLHSTELSALQTALNTRLTFDSTRLGQLNTYLGTIAQDITTGEITSSSGFYGQRYSFLILRLDTLSGSLIRLQGMNSQVSAQDSLIQDLIDTRNIYETVVRASLFSAPASGTSILHLKDASFLSQGDTVYVMAEGQEELLRAVKSINGNAVTLNDIIPSKYRPNEFGRLYKVLI